MDTGPSEVWRGPTPPGMSSQVRTGPSQLSSGDDHCGAESPWEAVAVVSGHFPGRYRATWAQPVSGGNNRECWGADGRERGPPYRPPAPPATFTSLNTTAHLAFVIQRLSIKNELPQSPKAKDTPRRAEPLSPPHHPSGGTGCPGGGLCISAPGPQGRSRDPCSEGGKQPGQRVPWAMSLSRPHGGLWATRVLARPRALHPALTGPWIQAARLWAGGGSWGCSAGWGSAAAASAPSPRHPLGLARRAHGTHLLSPDLGWAGPFPRGGCAGPAKCSGPSGGPGPGKGGQGTKGCSPRPQQGRLGAGELLQEPTRRAGALEPPSPGVQTDCIPTVWIQEIQTAPLYPKCCCGRGGFLETSRKSDTPGRKIGSLRIIIDAFF